MEEVVVYEGFAWQRGRRMCVWWKNYYVINSSGGIIKFSTLQAKEEEQLGELVFRIRKGVLVNTSMAGGKPVVRLESRNSNLVLRLEGVSAATAFLDAIQRITREDIVRIALYDDARMTATAGAVVQPAVDHSTVPASKLQELLATKEDVIDAAIPKRIVLDDGEPPYLDMQPCILTDDLRVTFRRSILTAIRTSLCERLGEACVLVMDPPTLASVSAVLTMSDLTAAGCSSVKQLGVDVYYPSDHRLYLVSPEFRTQRVLSMLPFAQSAYRDAVRAMCSYCTDEQWDELIADVTKVSGEEDVEGNKVTTKSHGKRETPAGNASSSLSMVASELLRGATESDSSPSASLVLTHFPSTLLWHQFQSRARCCKSLDPCVIVACCDYFPLDSGLFSLGLSRCLTPLLGARPARSELITSSESMIAAEIADGGKRQRTIPTDKVTTMSVISSKLVSLLLSLGCSGPVIRFDSQRTALPGMLAATIVDEIGHIGPLHSDYNSSEHVELFIVDRTFDLPASLLHDFSAQAFLHDVLQLDADVLHVVQPGCSHCSVGRSRFSCGKPSGFPCLCRMCAVSDAHEYWSEWKRLHVGKVGDELSRLTSGDGKLEEASAQAARHLVDRVKIIASLRNYQELLSAAFTASEAESLTGALIPVSGSGNVSVIELEQWIVNGLDSSGDRVNVRKIYSTLKNVLPLALPHIRLRLVLLWCAVWGPLTAVQEEDVFPHLLISQQILVYAFHSLGLCTSRSELDYGLSSSDLAKTKVRLKKGEESEGNFIQSLYLPKLKILLDEIIERRVSEERYPSLLTAPGRSPERLDRSRPVGMSSRRRPKSPSVAPSPAGLTSSRPPIVVLFVIGGVSLSEAHVVHEANKRGTSRFLIGGTSITNPARLVTDLAYLA